MAPRTRVRSRDSALPEARVTVDPTVAAALMAERVVAEQISRLKFISYADYCKLLLGMPLTDGQAAITRVIYDGKAPDEDSRDKFFGGQKEAPSSYALRTAVIICGRGSGKTSMFCAARALHLALTADLSQIPLSETALVAIVGPKLEHAQHTLAFVKGFLTERPFLKRVLKAEITKEKVKLSRLDGHSVSIEARAASAGGDSVRGPSLAGVILDEAAFFEGEGYEVNDDEIYRAARPRLVPGSQIIFASTPWAQAGKLWELFRDNFGKSDSAIVCKAPTLLVRPSEDTRRAYETELKTDPDNARREYDAEFLSSNSERFFPESVISASVDDSLSPPLIVAPGERVRFGGDFAFASDSSALFGFVERGGKLVCCDMDEQKPAEGHPLVPSEVVRRFAERMHQFGAKLLVADGWYRQAIEEHLSHYGIALVNASSPPSANYVLARSLMAQGLVRIPNHPRLLAQLRRVRATVKPGGNITIQIPRSKESGHGDMVSALVCALNGVELKSCFPKEGPKSRAEAEALAAKEEQKRRLEENQLRLAKQNKRMLLWMRRTLGDKRWRALTK